MTGQPLHFDERIRVLADTVARLQRRDATRSLLGVLSKTYPADIALVLRSLNKEEVTAVFLAVPKESASETLTYLTPRVLSIILDEVSSEQLIPILEEVAPDDLADFMGRIDPAIANALMAKMGKDSKLEIEELLQYATDTAGGIMTSDFFSLPGDMSVETAIEAIHNLSDVEMVFYLYITDDEGRLTGVISLRQLVLAKSDISLHEIMNSRVIKVYTDTDQEEVARLAQNYRILAVPVVDVHEVLVGMITVDDIIDVIQEETTRDMLKMAGTDETEILTRSPFKIARIRLPWLLAAFAGGLAATGIIHHFESILTQVLALSAFLPIIMGMAGNVGVQTATVAVRGLATGSINLQQTRQVVLKEMGVGVLLGTFYGIVLALFGWLAFGDIALGQIVGLTVLTNMIGAAILAILLPMFFHRIGTDPAIATGPFVTTAIDILGVANYFIIASLILGIA